jgi:hypothetical protein
VLIKTDSVNNKCENVTNESEEKRRRLSSDNQESFEISNSEGHFVSREHDRERGEQMTKSGNCNEEINHNASRDAHVLVPTKTESSDSSSKRSLENNCGGEWGIEAMSSRTFYKEATLTVANDHAITAKSKSKSPGDFLSNSDCLSSLVSSLYSNESSDDD